MALKRYQMFLGVEPMPDEEHAVDYLYRLDQRRYQKMRTTWENADCLPKTFAKTYSKVAAYKDPDTGMHPQPALSLSKPKKLVVAPSSAVETSVFAVQQATKDKKPKAQLKAAAAEPS